MTSCWGVPISPPDLPKLQKGFKKYVPVIDKHLNMFLST